MRSYAQNFEDVMLERLFAEVTDGFYVDVGASHPEALSVTRHFYEKGWRGVNVEPEARSFAALELARPRDVNLRFAIGSGEPLRFWEVRERPELSTMDKAVAERLKADGYKLKKHEVETRPLDAVFDRYCPRRVEFLKIDVEGYEKAVLDTLDLRLNRPVALLIEATQPGGGLPSFEDPDAFAVWSAWEPRVLASGYVFAHFDGLNRFYVRQEDVDLAKRLRLPPGFFDGLPEVANRAFGEISAAADERLSEVRKQAARIVELEAMAAQSAAAAEARLFEIQERDGRLRAADGLSKVIAEQEAALAEAQAAGPVLQAQAGRIAELEGVSAALQHAADERLAEIQARDLRLRESERQLEALVGEREADAEWIGLLQAAADERLGLIQAQGQDLARLAGELGEAQAQAAAGETYRQAADERLALLTKQGERLSEAQAQVVFLGEAAAERLQALQVQAGELDAVRAAAAERLDLIHQQQAEIDAVRAAAADRLTLINQQQAEIDAVRAAAADRLTLISQQQAEIDAVRKAADERLALINTQQAALAEAEHRAGSAAALLEAREAELATFREAAEARLALSQRQAEEIASLQGLAGKLVADLKDGQKAIAAAERLAAQRAEELAALRSNAAQAMEENDARLLEIAELRERLDALREDGRLRTVEVARLRADLADGAAALTAERKARGDAEARLAGALALSDERQVTTLRQAEALVALRSAATIKDATLADRERQLADVRGRLRAREGALAESAEREDTQGRRLAEAQAVGEARLHEIGRVSRAMWSARGRLRDVEAEEDRRRFATLRDRIGGWARGPGWDLARTLAYQAAPPKPDAPRRITVVTPVFNGAETLCDTIDSVLAQDYPNLEFIIVDGGSTDATMEIVRAYGDVFARVISEPDRGMYDAIGKGFDEATGDILCYLNSDDVFEPDALRRVDRAFAETDDAQVVYFEDDVLVEGWKFPNIAQPHLDHLSLLEGHIVSQDGVFFSRRAYNYVGGINRDMRFAGDWDLWVRLSERFRFHRQPGHVSSFRVRAGQLSGDMTVYEAERTAERQRRYAAMSRLDLALHRLDRWRTRQRNKADVRTVQTRREYYYPIDFWEMPATAAEGPPAAPVQARCPIDRSAPDELLFSKANPTHGARRISWIYRHEAADWISIHPPVPRDDLTALRAAALSHSGDLSVPDRSLGGSPFKGFKSGRGAHAAYALKAPPASFRRHAGPYVLAEARAEAVERCVGDAAGGGRRALDVGSGDGLLLDRLRDRGWDAVGCEPAAVFAEAARARGHTVLDIAPDRLIDALPPDAAFDLVLLDELIEHFPDPLSALVQLSALLAPGGRLMVTAPNIAAEQRRMFGPTWSLWHSTYRTHLFSPASLGALAAAAGLKVAACRTFSTVADSWLSQNVHFHGIGLKIPLGLHTPPPDSADAEALAGYARATFDPAGTGDRLCAVLRRDFET